MSCLHDWEPIQGWVARYRCSACRVIGYKPAAVHPRHCRLTSIVPYRCEAKEGGARCPEPAVHCVRGKRFRCAGHLGRGRTAPARKALAGVPAGIQATASHDDATAGREQATPSRDDATASREQATPGHDDATASREQATASHDDATASREQATASRDDAGGSPCHAEKGSP